jgi:hypothetical protein
VTPFATDQWVILLLMFLLGLFLGMYFLAGGKWKRRYREEVARREVLEREHREEITRRETLERDHRELQSTRAATDRHPVDRTRGPL